jgi:flagellar assembly factor FliW
MAKEGSLRHIITPLLGGVEFRENEVFTATTGLLGFEKLKEFLLLSSVEIEPFRCLQSIEDPQIAFTVLDPHYFLPEYRAELAAEEVADLEAKNVRELREFAIVTIPAGKPERMTANLQAPIIVNFESRKLKQVVLATTHYHTRHSILDLLKKGRE